MDTGKPFLSLEGQRSSQGRYLDEWCGSEGHSLHSPSDEQGSVGKQTQKRLVWFINQRFEYNLFRSNLPLTERIALILFNII